MWVIYEVAETTNPEDLEAQPTFTTYPEIFSNYQDLMLTLSEIYDRYQTQIPLTHREGTYNISYGIPQTLEELNFGTIGRDYQVYSISTNLGTQKIYGYIRKCEKMNKPNYI